MALLLVVIVSLSLAWVFPYPREITAGDIQRCLDSLGNGDPDDPDAMRGLAYELAAVLFDNPAQCNKFADEVTEIYFASKDIDFLLVYNTGGFGGATMEGDPEWPSILNGIQAELDDLGYESMIVEYQRGKGGIIGFIGEVEELKNNYPSKAPELAAKVAFLTKYNPDLKVITTGRCFGAVVSNEVMELEVANPQVYSIQAGVPFWYTDPGGERSLVIEENGIMPDILGSKGLLVFIWALAKANLDQLPSTSPSEEGSIRVLNWYIKAPGHTYTWDHLEVRSEVIDFLEKNFPPNIEGI